MKKIKNIVFCQNEKSNKTFKKLDIMHQKVTPKGLLLRF